MLLCNCYFILYNFFKVIIKCYNFVKFKILLNYPKKPIVNVFLNYCNKLISQIVLFNKNDKRKTPLYKNPEQYEYIFKRYSS